MKYLFLTVCIALVHLHLSAQIGHYLTATDGQPQDFYGRSVDISGDFAIIGADGDDDLSQSLSNVGSAYIYQFDGKNWQFFQKISPANPQGNERFGYAVAIHGLTIVVGAISAEGLTFATGAAYIFAFDGVQWMQSKKIIASDGQAIDFYGHDVAVSGTSIIVGAPNEGVVPNRTGAVYLYELVDTGWAELDKITPSDSIAGGFFGRSVSISGNTAVAGAPVYPNVVNSPGQVYILEFDGDHWSEHQILQSSDAISDDNFGYAVAIDNDQLIATSPFISGPSFTSAAAYVFNFEDSLWIEHQKAPAPENPNAGVYGADAAIDGNIAVVGAYLDEQGQRGGAAYVFRKEMNEWNPFTKLKGSDFSYFDIAFTEFGNPVALSGNNCIAGTLDTNVVLADEGVAIIVDLSVPVNDRFSEAILVDCGDTISQSTAFATRIDLPDTCVTGFPQIPGLWYRLEGNGKNITASLCGSTHDTRMAVYVEGVNDTILYCIAGNDNSCNLRSSVVFSTTSTENYFIYITSADTFPGNFELVIDCNVPMCNTAPVAYTDQIGLTDARINWDPVPGSLQYKILGSVLGGQQTTFVLPATQTNFIVNKLTPGETYAWRVKSLCDLSGNSQSAYSNMQYFSTLSVCPAPASLWTTNITETSVRLNWSNVPVASTYRIKGSLVVNPNANWNIDINDPNITSLDVSGIAPGFSYRWSIITNCSFNVSTNLTYDTFTTIIPLNPKTDIEKSVEMKEGEIRIYPNPVTDLLYVYDPSHKKWLTNAARDQTLKLRIFDLTGRLVFVKDLRNSEAINRISLPKALQNGIYQVSMSKGDHHQLNRLVIMR